MSMSSAEPLVQGLPGALWPSAEAAALLHWNVAAFWSGDWWRAWTHVVVHADVWHLAGNLAAAMALAVLWAQVGLVGRRAAWHALGLWAGYGLLCLGFPGPAWGASGLLHAAAAWGALLALDQSRNTSQWGGWLSFGGALTLALWLKVGLEAYLDMPGLAWGLHLSGLLCAGIGAEAAGVLARWRDASERGIASA